MTLTIHSTDRIVMISGVPARVWEGKTESGIDVHCLITRVAVQSHEDRGQFERELIEQPPSKPSAASIAAFPLRMIL